MVLEFCRIKVLLHVQINDDPNEPAVDDIEVDGINDSDEEDDTPQETYELRTDWMLLAEMMSNRQTRSLDDFSAHILAAVPSSSNSYVDESLLRYPEIEEAESFIQQAIGRLHEIAKEHNLHENNMVVAPTGVAAFNIEGSTIHSSLSVPICGVNVELEGEFFEETPKKTKIYIFYNR
ncbi:hypothetical protein GLOIN_2v1584397 [Rhizophagus irregularis DAOM 181602=DAOM 197198]|nr:hypothetical protein GLOIN_2v1584397 [Rhizophagus irregularis DAOM 181602=DAOM 197198]